MSTPINMNWRLKSVALRNIMHCIFLIAFAIDNIGFITNSSHIPITRTFMRSHWLTRGYWDFDPNLVTSLQIKLSDFRHIKSRIKILEKLIRNEIKISGFHAHLIIVSTAILIMNRVGSYDRTRSFNKAQHCLN